MSRTFTVSVRDLVDFVLRRGDLGGRGEFVGWTRALEGTRGHQRLQRSRPQGYQSEVTVELTIEEPNLRLIIAGRIDGVLISNDGVMIEEIKTTLGLRKQPDPLHWAQGKIYSFIYASKHSLPEVELQLTYLDLHSGAVAFHRQTFSRDELAAFFDEVIGEYKSWLSDYTSWRELRDASIRLAQFPYASPRPGQPQLISAADTLFARGGRLFVEAPTGLGKTIAILWPAVQALAGGSVEKVFYLTAKTVGRFSPMKALADLRQTGLRVRSLILTAKEKICFNAGAPCDLRTCPYALGYYDRVKRAVRDCLEHDMLDQPAIEAIAQRHQVCPYALSVDVSRWVDVLVCDYNYVFDPKVYLKDFFEAGSNAYGFLIDEAHNLVDRAREMFSAELNGQELREVQRAVQHDLPRCGRALKRLRAGLAAFCDSDSEASLIDADSLSQQMDLPWQASSTPRRQPPGPTPADGKATPPTNAARPEAKSSVVRREVPAELIALLQTVLQEMERWLVQNQPAQFHEALLNGYFQCLGFIRVAQQLDSACAAVGDTRGGHPRLRLLCLDPSSRLREAAERGKASVFFSGTLSPMEYFQQVLGAEAADPNRRLASPFPPEHLRVVIAEYIATNYKRRASTFEAVAEAIRVAVQAKTGNYLVYFPSYAYLEQVLERFRMHRIPATLQVQTPGMSEQQRESFLAAFRENCSTTQIGFAVMGGIFGEGIDLAGDRLVGVIVVGVGLPQISLERDLIRMRFDEMTGAGFDYAYAFPGFNRVLQAAGRVIRSETDRGIVLLIDVRFAQARYRALFPSAWQPHYVHQASELQRELEHFWSSPDPKSAG